jgi:hypothetical protein
LNCEPAVGGRFKDFCVGFPEKTDKQNFNFDKKNKIVHLKVNRNDLLQRN